jgi:hypothetical protein
MAFDKSRTNEKIVPTSLLVVVAVGAWFRQGLPILPLVVAVLITLLFPCCSVFGVVVAMAGQGRSPACSRIRNYPQAMRGL